ncbi:substrate-binding periplasmic protein [Duganella aceris]|uniref:Transporter substrate-binding domain-containing protein n=1 Tax=Duganella aceris TaxID=2703883 RepID=A0ABX0FGV2_9BURK|nr:transporter substrate-binding domain-containing protein [Duganella aceris]NGZ83784.1 transporter substrate-binding domain-containing protein [Duganella aceris]
MLALHRTLAAAGLLLLALHVRAGETITLTSGEWQPYLSAQAPHYGPVSRIVSEAFALEGVTVNYVFRPWSRAYLEAVSGGANGTLVWSTAERDSDRMRRFYFSDVVFEGKSVFFYRKAFQWDRRTLVGVRLGGTAGYDYLFDSDPAITIDRTAPSDELNFRKLAAGRFDVFPANLDSGRYILREEMTAEQAAQITWDPKPYNITPYHLLLNKSNPSSQRLMVAFNKGLKRLKDSGKYAEYMQSLK